MRNRLIIWLFSAFLIVSISLLLFCQLNRYKNQLRQRLDPLETSRLDPGTGPIEDGFWIIGDSRAASWEKDQLSYIRADIANLGIHGQTSKQVLERFRSDLDKSKPSCILVQVGINDLKSIGLLDDGLITRHCIRNIQQIFEICKKHSINAIYCAIFPPGDIELLRRPFWEPATLDSLKLVNKEMMEYCCENIFIYFDAYKLLEDQSHPGTVEKGYQSDFLHINSAGYRQISQALRKRLMESGEDWAMDLIY